MTIARLIIPFVLLSVFLQYASTRELKDIVRRRQKEIHVDGGWSSWGSWSNYTDCPVNCGSNFIHRTRVRKCDNPPPSKGNDCVGFALETKLTTCFADDCPGKGQDHVGTIFQWSPCLPVCGNGVKIRAKGSCDPNNKSICADRRLHWEARNCINRCSGHRRRKRWFASLSHSVDNTGSTNWKGTLDTPAGSFSGGLDFDRSGHVSGGSVGYGGNVGIASGGISVGYGKTHGFSTGVEGSLGIPGVGRLSGEAAHNFGDGSNTYGGSYSYDGLSVGAKYNTKSGWSGSTGRYIGRKRSTNSRKLVEDVICGETGENLFGHPKDCRVYIACHDGVAYYDSCAGGMVWDDSVNRCEPVTSNNCHVADNRSDDIFAMQLMRNKTAS